MLCRWSDGWDKKIKWFHLWKWIQELNPAQWTSDAALCPFMWRRSFLYCIAKAACYAHAKASQFADIPTGSSEKWIDCASILLQFLLELTLWKPSWKKAVPDLLINQHTAVHHPRYLCFLQKTNWLNMQVPTHIWTGLTRCIMKFYLSNLIKAVWDSNNTKEKEEFHSLSSLSLFYKKLNSE